MEDESEAVAHARESQDAKVNVRRKKTQRSCDRCRLRKTKVGFIYMSTADAASAYFDSVLIQVLKKRLSY